MFCGRDSCDCPGSGSTLNRAIVLQHLKRSVRSPQGGSHDQWAPSEREKENGKKRGPSHSPTAKKDRKRESEVPLC